MKKLLTVLAASAVLFAGCSLKNENKIIKVNDQFITQAQFDKAFNETAKNSMFAKMGVDIKKDPNSYIYIAIKQQTLNELIVKSLIEQELTKRGITATKEDIENAIKDVIETVGSKEQLAAALKQYGISNAKFKQELENEVKLKKLVAELGKSDVTDKEIKDYYKKNMAKFKEPEKVRASHILISANPAEIEEMITSDSKNKDLTPEQIKAKVDEEMTAKKAKAEELLNKVKANVNDFAKLAQENSEDTGSASKGGDLGFFKKQDMVEEFSKAAFALRPNTVKDVTTPALSKNLVKTKFGYHIILVTDRMEPVQYSLENVKTKIQSQLTYEKQMKLIDNLIESLKKNAQIEYLNEDYNPETIKKQIEEQAKKQIEQAKKQNKEIKLNKK